MKNETSLDITDMTNTPASKRSLVPPFSAKLYTHVISNIYDLATTFTGWRRKIARYALEGFTPPAKMLDVGCGTGYLLNIAREMGFDAIGADPSSGMLEEAQKKYGFDQKILFEVPAHDIPLPSESFDIVIASGSLVYVTEIQKAAIEITRLLKKGGKLRIIDHALPIHTQWNTKLVGLFCQLSGDVFHHFPTYFAKGMKLEKITTLGRGGYLQRFDFTKL